MASIDNETTGAENVNAYLNMTTKQLSATYRVAYQNHMLLAQQYADGNTTDAELKASSDNLKAIRAAYRAEEEANQIRKH